MDIKLVAHLPFGGQGITYSDNYWYYSATWWRYHFKKIPQFWREGYIYKLDNKFRIIKHTFSPVLPEYDHPGGLDFYNKAIFIALEDRNYIAPKVAMLDENLKLLGIFRISKQRGCPWLAIHNNLLYTSEFTTDSINYFTLSGQYRGSIKLNQKLFKVQGGKFYKDKLYLSCDDPKSIYSINLDGTVTLFAKISIENEVEDIHINEDGTIYFIDHQGLLYEVLE